MDKDTLKDDEVAEVSPDDILYQTGGCGRFQVILSTLLHVMKGVPCWSLLGMTFITYVPSWRCADDNSGGNFTLQSEQYTDSRNGSQFAVSENASEPFWNKRCSTLSGQKCTRFEFESGFTTVSTEYDLICDLEWVKSTCMSIQLAGMCMGNFISGQLADLFGRKRPFFTAMALLFAGNLVAFFATGWVMFAVTRLFIGLGCGFFLTLIYNILSEYTLSKWRSAVVGMPTWAAEACILALVCWLLHNWRYLVLTTSLLSAASFTAWWFVPEGFRWLFARERYNEAENIIKNVSKWNNHPAPDFHLVRKLVVTETTSPKKYTLIELFRRKALLKLILPLIIGWMNLGLSSYGILFGIQKLSGSIYINMFLFNVTTSPPKFITIFLQNRYGRKAASCITFACTGVGGLVVGILQYIDTPHRDALTSAFAMVAFIGVSSAWGPMQTMTLEVFPTVIRSTGFGFLSVMGRIGAIIGPQLVFANEFVPGVMYFVICVLSFLAILGITFLPETANKSLIDVLDDTLENKEEHTSKSSPV